MRRSVMVSLMWTGIVLALGRPDAVAQGSLLLVGGGTENYNDWSDGPYRWFVTHAPNRKILVLHYADTTSWFSGYFPSLSPCSVSNRAISSVTQANDSAVYRFILEHDGIFLRGGDQSQYVRYWKGTLAEEAIRTVYQRGGVVGGTSAGEMVLGELVYTGGSTDNGAALRRPTGTITLEDSFLSLATGLMAESHTNERGRVGRLPVVMARCSSETGKQITGLGVDANTALAIGADGVAEVMGGSAVTILRWLPGTTFSIQNGKPFSMRNMSFDNLIPGFSVDLRSGRIGVPASARPFAAKLPGFPPCPVVLDGSGNSADWTAPTGSLKKTLALSAGRGDTVGIFSAIGTPASANVVSSTLGSWGVPSRLFWVSTAMSQDVAWAASIAGCRAFVIVDVAADSLRALLDTSKAVGRAFAGSIATGTPLLFIGDGAMLAGEKVIGGVYTSPYNAYYGTLTQVPGLDLLKGMQIVPRFYQNADNSTGYTSTENRIMGMLWSMGRSSLGMGVIIDAGSFVTVTAGNIQVEGTSPDSPPALILDARHAKDVGFPVFRRPGKTDPVNNAALTGCDLHIVRPGESLSVVTGLDRTHPEGGTGYLLEPGYPNPFNSTTTIRFHTSRPGNALVRVYDVLGRTVAELLDEAVSSGLHEIRWDASRQSSGSYFVRLEHRGTDGVQNRTMRLVLAR